QRLDVVEGTGEGGHVGAGIAGAVHGDDGVPDLRRVFHVYKVRDVVLAEAGVHRSAAIIRVCLLREQGYLSHCPTVSDTELPEITAKSGSRPISRVLWQGTPRRGYPRQPFLWARSYPLALATYPQ